MELRKYKGMAFMTVSIMYGGELVQFDLHQELKINEAKLDWELKNQASKYGFALMLFQKLKTEFEQLKQRRKQIYAELVKKAKRKLNNGRPLSNELAEAEVYSSKRYKRITARCIQAKDNSDALYAVCRALEQRKDLLQTLSSNNRKF